MYKEVTLENTLKLMIRCKMTYNSKEMILKCFDLFEDYENKTNNLKAIIDK